MSIRNWFPYHDIRTKNEREREKMEVYNVIIFLVVV